MTTSTEEPPMTPLDLAVDILAVHRLTRLATSDVITRPPRAGIIRWAYQRKGIQPWSRVDADIDAMPHHDDQAPKLATLVTCPWCVSIYAAFLVTASHRYRWAAPIRYALALSTAASLIANRETPE